MSDEETIDMICLAHLQSTIIRHYKHPEVEGYGTIYIIIYNIITYYRAKGYK